MKSKSSESIQSKIIEPACAEFSVTQVGNSAKRVSSLFNLSDITWAT